jgi:hypothetical protein
MALRVTIKISRPPNFRSSYVMLQCVLPNICIGLRIKQAYCAHFDMHESRSTENQCLMNQADKPGFQCNVNMTKCN